MKDIIRFIRHYYRDINKPILITCTLFMAVLIWLNYAEKLEIRLIRNAGLPFPYLTAHYIIFFIAFLVPYILLLIQKKKDHYLRPSFVLAVFIAPLIFALKVSIDTTMQVSSDIHWNQYWNDILYWPPRLVMILILIGFMKRFVLPAIPGLTPDQCPGLTPGFDPGQKMNWKPYWLMLLIMVPLIAAASTQPDFLATYPKMKEILPLPGNAHPSWWYKLLFELSYGSDFFSIEIFFRGFLVIGFMRWAGKDAILPMACFYCTIHFGKPLGECISSYFGGLLLGIVSYNTRSIYGGLMVHLGIAWLMELGGYIGNSY